MALTDIPADKHLSNLQAAQLNEKLSNGTQRFRPPLQFIVDFLFNVRLKKTLHASQV